MMYSTVIFYLSFFEKIKHELPSFSRQACLEQLSIMFPLTDEDKRRVQKAFENEDFCALNNHEEVVFYEQMLDVLGADTEGELFSDKAAIGGKRAAYKVIDELKNEKSIIMHLGRNAYRERTALLLYSAYSSLYRRRMSEELLSSLKKLSLPSSGKPCDMEGTLICLYNDRANASRYIDVLERSEIDETVLLMLKRNIEKQEELYYDNKVG